MNLNTLTKLKPEQILHKIVLALHRSKVNFRQVSDQYLFQCVCIANQDFGRPQPIVASHRIQPKLNDLQIKFDMEVVQI